MSENNDTKKKVKKKKKLSKFKIFIIIVLVLMLLAGAIVGGLVLAIIDDAPDIDPTNINASLDQTSFILTPDGEVLEKIQASELRTVVSLDQVPEHLKDAFISIEDERFYSHRGVDPRGIVASAVDNIKAGRIVRGASTITQQLVKNVYLTKTKSWERKIKEAYLALQVEDVLTKDQILELYLNRIFLGQNAYGIQEAAQTYFSKDVSELTIAESALIAGVAKSSLQFAPYHTIRPEDFDPEKHDEIAHLDLAGEKYIAVYNPESIERQNIVLKQMFNLGKITETEYNEALNEDIRANLKPAEKTVDGISSYFADYVKTQVVETLMTRLDYTEEEAHREVTAGGLKIYSTIDLEMQRKLEDTYANFADVLQGGSGSRGPVLIDWKLNGSQDIIDNNNRIIYYTKGNLFNDSLELKIDPNEYRIENDNLIVKSNKLKAYSKHIDVADYYIIDEKRNLVTYPVGSISLPEEQFHVNESNELVIMSDYLRENNDFYRIDEAGNLLISNNYFYMPKSGIVQPQSATVVLDYKQGHIKALVGGRDIKGAKMLNRATASQRQPGSVMKPIAAYLPAIDNGFTAASTIDDIPFYSNGELWPNNWYRERYKGLITVRNAMEQSSNVASVKVVNQVGVGTSLKYLEKMGIIKNSSPLTDSFITAAENPTTNDENLSALGLGGMTRGLTPLEVTAAFGSIANDGVYIEPMSFYKIEDKNGNILIDDTKNSTEVVSPQKAFILKDMLRTTVSNGIARRAQIPNMATAGKTGTTQNQADIWFVGFSPYYATGVWIGNDSPAITVSKGSGSAAELWKHIMVQMHEGLENKPSFDRPEGIVSANVCRDSGLLASEACSRDPRGSRVYSEIFAEGTVPTKTCDIHVEASIDSASGQLATDYCPKSNITSRVFLNKPYNPDEHEGIVPTDYQYRLPSKSCSIHDANTPVGDEKLEEGDEEYDEEGNLIPKDKESDQEEDKKTDKDNNKIDDNDDVIEFPLDLEPEESKDSNEDDEKEKDND